LGIEATDRWHANGRNRRMGDIGQRANEGPVSDPKATFGDAVLTGSFCPKAVRRKC